jgi:hypothetical protein
MNQPLVTIITPTYNRPAMFAECAAAVLAQSFTDWIWWPVINRTEWPSGYEFDMHSTVWNDPRVVPVWYPVAERWRAECYTPARIINWLYPKITTPYIYFLADDDLIDPDGLEVLVNAIGEENWDGNWIARNRDGMVDSVYGRCEVLDQQPDGSYKHGAWCYDSGDVGMGTAIDPNCRLDGGQVLHTADLWRRATADGWQLTDRNADAAACDGILLARLAEFARFHYVPQRIVTHRRHAGAAHHRPQVT